ncbi:MAG: 4'-phosphopantetheinyl transferase superfamily protein [Clostridiales bacterium]|nr:4'-phosphopantetheinyl transferase superfamily protein [Clostridiales bacterium]
MIFINCIDISKINSDNYQMLRQAVSNERRMRADRYHFIEDSKRSICSELLLQYSLFQTFGRFIEIDTAYNEFGKPFMKDMKGFSYNISHSGKWVVIGFGENELGIDIEEIYRGREDIANKFFTESEKKFIFAANNEEEAKRSFTQIWTLKESYIKYLGTGLSTMLDSFSVNAIEGVVVDQDGVIQKDIRLKNYRFNEDYYLSICSTDEEVEIREIMLKDLIQFIKKK